MRACLDQNVDEAREKFITADEKALYELIWKRAIASQMSDAQIEAFVNSLQHFGMGWSWGGFESLIIPVYPERVQTATKWDVGGPCLRLDHR